MRKPNPWGRRLAKVAVAGALCLGATDIAQASDHLDTPRVIADPRADIGDIFAWTSPDAHQLNLVMTIVGHGFSDKLAYVFHVDSGPTFGPTTKTTTITCSFAGKVADCRAGDADAAHGDASGPDGLKGRRGRFRVFAGLRDDPFFNNVKGTRDAYDVASQAIAKGAIVDPAGCPSLDAATTRAIAARWRHTNGGPATNMLAGWTPASIVISIDLAVVSKGGDMLAVWAETTKGADRIDRMGRPLTGNALLATLGPAEASDQLKEQYNRATPATAAPFIPAIETSLGLYDAFDGECGNTFLADRSAGASRYLPLAVLLADDRLWVNGASGVCTQLFAVERAALGGETALRGDCGGRTPNYDAVDVYRSLLVNGTTAGVDDGVDRDERRHSSVTFPFLAAPENPSNANP